jgi:uncharacterized cupredoxin-like copper-binding protein
MSRPGSASIAPVLAAGVMLTLFGGLTSTNAARTQLARTATIDASSRSATVAASDLAFSAARIDARAGKLRLTLRNEGSVAHEFVVLRTPADPAALEVGTDGRVSEDASIGEVAETASGTSKSATFELQPGRYVFVCNLPGHYGRGMRGAIVVR